MVSGAISSSPRRALGCRTGTDDEVSDETEQSGFSPGRGSDTFKHGYPPARAEPGVVTVPVLVPDSGSVSISGRFPISERDWNQLMTVLSAMKLGMVEDKAAAGPKPPEGWEPEKGPEPD